MINDDPGELVVFRRSPEHRGSAYVNILYCLSQGTVRAFDGIFKRIKIDNDKVDRRNVQLFHDLIVPAAPPEQAAVDFRVQCFHPAVHDLREPGVGGYVRNLNIMGL